MRGTEFPVTTLLSVNISWEQTLGGQKKKKMHNSGEEHKTKVGNGEKEGETGWLYTVCILHTGRALL